MSDQQGRRDENKDEQKDENSDWRELLKKDRGNDKKNGWNPFRGGRFRFSMWYLFLAILLISLMNMFFFPRRGQFHSLQ